MSPKDRHKAEASDKRRSALVAEIRAVVAEEVKAAVAQEVSSQIKALPPHNCVVLDRMRTAGMWAGATVFGAFLVAFGTGLAFALWEGTKALLHIK